MLTPPKQISFKNIVDSWAYTKKEQVSLSVYKIATSADKQKLIEITAWIAYVAELLGYEMVEKGQLPDYSYRKLPKILLNKKSLAFRKKESL